MMQGELGMALYDEEVDDLQMVNDPDEEDNLFDEDDFGIDGLDTLDDFGDDFDDDDY